MLKSRHKRQQSSVADNEIGTNKIKRRIRDVERLLKRKRSVLPHTVIRDKERVLESLRVELAGAQTRELERKNAARYHMVRFFERKKALRRYKRCKTEDDQSPSEDTKRKLLEASIDLCYVVNFPKTEKYLALYPEADSDSSTNERRATYRDLVAEHLKKDTLPVSLTDILQGKKLGKSERGLRLLENLSKSEQTVSDVHSTDDKDDFFE